MKEWSYLVWMLLWVLFTTVDFSFQVGEKNQVTIEKVEKKESKEELKADW